MGILGITNRSENWKTVEHFYGLDNDAKTRLVEQLGIPEGLPARDIRIEFFWYGIRDYLDQVNVSIRPDHGVIARSYEELFGDLREKLENYRTKSRPHKFRRFQDHNYDASEENWETLFNNLSRAEIDVVLETPDHLFIGEAKHESKLRGRGKLVLVHQLIRQYVMANVLVNLVAAARNSAPKQVIPFVVGDDIVNLRKFHQVEFMIQQHNCNRSPGDWLREGNVLSWECIRQITNPESTHDCSRLTCKEG